MFYRKGFQYDNLFDWTMQNMQQERSRLGPERAGPSDNAQQAADAQGRERADKERNSKTRDDNNAERSKVRACSE